MSNPAGPQGVDLSSWNFPPKVAAPVNFEKLQRDPVDFVFGKATQGTYYKNPHYGTIVSECERLGILWGPYHYFDATQNGVPQADYFVNTVGSIIHEKGVLQPVIDFEETFGVTDLDLIERRARAFIERVKDRTGREVTIYTYPYFWQRQLRDPHTFTDCPLWIARYGTPDPGQLPGGWKFYSFWQYTANGRAAGISGNVDRNVFNGNIDRLRKFAGY